MRKLTKAGCILCLIILISACGYQGYSGEHPELYTVAINSLLWNTGHSYGADKAIDSQINIIEQDQFGRTLFSYYEKYYSGAKISFSALIVSQGVQDNYVYYYEDSNYLIKQQVLFTSNIVEFTEENREYLKLLNDWNTPLDYQKCIKKEIVRKKANLPYDSHIIKEKVIDVFDLQNQEYNMYLDYLTSDDNDHIIVYGAVISQEDIYFVGLATLENNSISVSIIFSPNNVFDYRLEMIHIKNNYGWNY